MSHSLFEAYEDWAADRIVLEVSLSDGPKHGASMHFDMRAEAARTLGLALLNAVAKFDDLNAGLAQPKELPVVISVAKELTPNKDEATFARADGAFVPLNTGEKETFKAGERVIDNNNRTGTVFNWSTLAKRPCKNCIPVRYDDTTYQGETRHITAEKLLRKLVLIPPQEFFETRSMQGSLVWLCNEKKVGVVDGINVVSKDMVNALVDGVPTVTPKSNLMGIM